MSKKRSTVDNTHRTGEGRPANETNQHSHEENNQREDSDVHISSDCESDAETEYINCHYPTHTIVAADIQDTTDLGKFDDTPTQAVLSGEGSLYQGKH